MEYLLQNFRNTIPQQEMHEEVPRQPTLITAFVSHATRAIVNPSNHAYPLIMRFLLQRPQLDVKNVPLFFDLLLSYSEDRRWERGWILKLLRDGVKSSLDWQMMKRRHNWDVLATLYESSTDDTAIKTLIEEVALTLTSNPATATNLVTSKPFLMWINQQFAITKIGSRSLKNFLEVISNIIKNGDIAAIDYSSRGVWRSEVYSIANLATKYNDVECLRLSSEILHSLSNLPMAEKYNNNILLGAVEVLLKNLVIAVSRPGYDVDENYKSTLKNLGLVYAAVQPKDTHCWIKLISRLLATGDEDYYNMVIGQLHNYL